MGECSRAPQLTGRLAGALVGHLLAHLTCMTLLWPDAVIRQNCPSTQTLGKWNEAQRRRGVIRPGQCDRPLSHSPRKSITERDTAGWHSRACTQASRVGLVGPISAHSPTVPNTPS